MFYGAPKLIGDNRPFPLFDLQAKDRRRGDRHATGTKATDTGRIIVAAQQNTAIRKRLSGSIPGFLGKLETFLGCDQCGALPFFRAQETSLGRASFRQEFGSAGTSPGLFNQPRSPNVDLRAVEPKELKAEALSPIQKKPTSNPFAKRTFNSRSDAAARSLRWVRSFKRTRTLGKPARIVNLGAKPVSE